MIIENSEGGIELVRVCIFKVRICFRYLMGKNGCKDLKCFRYYVCKYYFVNGVCSLGKKCRYSYSYNLKSFYNKNIIKRRKFNCFLDE